MKHILSVLCICALFVSTAQANEQQAKIAEKMEKAVVKIHIVEQGIDVGSGSGFFISQDGLILTNMHVLSMGFSPTLTVQVETRDGKRTDDITVLRCRDERQIDLCLFKINYKPQVYFNVTPMKFAKGSDVLVLGHPRGYDYTLSTGIVSGMYNKTVGSRTEFDKDGKTTSEKDISIEFVQISAPTSPGNSGGPIFDIQGHLIGMTTWGRIDQGSENLNFGISVGEMAEFVAHPKKPVQLSLYKKEVQAENKANAKKLHEKYTAAMLRALDAGADYNTVMKTFPVTMSFPGRDFTFHVPSLFAGDKRCKLISPDDKTRIYSCHSEVDDVDFMVKIQKMDNYQLGVSPFEKTQPRPLAIVKAYQKAGTWERMKKKLTAQQLKYLYSVPSEVKCRDEKKSLRTMWTNAKSCDASVYNDGVPGSATFDYYVQKKDDPYLVRVMVSPNDANMSYFYFDWAPFVAGSIDFTDKSPKL